MLKLSSTVLGISFLLDPTNVTRHSDGVTDGIFSLSSSDRLSDNAAFHSELMGFRPITANQNANVGKRVISFRKVFLPLLPALSSFIDFMCFKKHKLVIKEQDVGELVSH